MYYSAFNNNNNNNNYLINLKFLIPFIIGLLGTFLVTLAVSMRTQQQSAFQTTTSTTGLFRHSLLASSSVSDSSDSTSVGGRSSSIMGEWNINNGDSIHSTAVSSMSSSSNSRSNTNNSNHNNKDDNCVYRPTDEIYKSNDNVIYGKYKEIRKKLDYNYHTIYTKEREQLQDDIIDTILDEKKHCKNNHYKKHYIVFTAGAMGAGKTHTMRLLHEKYNNRFPLDAFITVDPDRIRYMLPEFNKYIIKQPNDAGELTRKEAGLICEILIEIALLNGYNVLIDGSLRDYEWYKTYIQQLRHIHPNLYIAIIHITASYDNILNNALTRAKVTGRVVPRKLIEQSIEQVPKSVEILKPYVDFCVEIHNTGKVGDDDIQLATPGIDWDTFEKQWYQPCG